METINRFPQDLICSEANMKLGGNEFLVLCAYDHNHRVLNHRYCEHLKKCRMNYELSKQKDGEEPLMVYCRYNMEHQMYAPELFYHEHNCTDRRLPWLESLYFDNIPLLEAIMSLDGCNEQADLEKTATRVSRNAPKQRRTSSKHAGAFTRNGDTRITEIIRDLMKDLDDSSTVQDIGISSSDLISLTYQLKKMVKDHPSTTIVQGILWADPKIVESSGTLRSMIAAKQSFELSYSALSQTMDPDSIGYNRRPIHSHRRRTLALNKGLELIHEEDPDEGSKLQTSGTGFDWLSHVKNLKGPFRFIPPGLTKAQRKVYEVELTERLKYEEGIFAEFEDEDIKEKVSISKGGKKEEHGSVKSHR